MGNVRHSLGFILSMMIVAFGINAGALALPTACPNDCCRPVNCCADAAHQQSAMPAGGDAHQIPCCSIESAPVPAWSALIVRPPTCDDDGPLRHALTAGIRFGPRSPRNAGGLPRQYDTPQSSTPIYLQTATLLC